MIRYGSVCSGIEAASVAWAPLGWSPAWFAEVEPFPSAVLAHHWPAVPNLGDFTRIHEHVEPGSIDLLVGGTPCQSFSVAGLRKGLDDPRGNLALEFLRLADAARPRWVVWENVPGILSVDRGRAFGAFLGGLGKLGFWWSYRVLDGVYFGTPQRRRRVFVVGHLGGRRGRAEAALFDRAQLPALAGTFCQVSPPVPPGHPARPGGDGGDGSRPGHLVFGLTGDETPKWAPWVVPSIRASQGGEGIMVSNGMVRRLTVREIERAMGFPADHTRVPFLGRPAGGCPDRHRKQALGNSMAVPVMRRIGERITFIEEIPG